MKYGPQPIELPFKTFKFILISHKVIYNLNIGAISR